jgi:hypothetical protein
LDGKIWLFWSAFTNAYPHIHYETYNWSSWSSDKVLVASPDPQQDVAPSIAQLKNGTMVLAFSSNRLGNFDIFLKTYNPGTGWSADKQITADTNDDFVTSLLVASDGRLWIFWDRSFLTGNRSIYVKSYLAGSWTAESILASNPYQNSTPSAYQTNDGKIWVVWSRALDQRFTQVYLYYRTTTDGVNWTPETTLTSTANNDRYPTIMQDSAGTLWLLWNRNLPIPATTSFQEDLFYKTSTDNGATWSAEGQITNDVSNPWNDVQATVAELKDHRLWVFWGSNRDPEGYVNLYYATLGPVLAHDLGITSISTSATMLRLGASFTVTVTLKNLGNYTESYSLTLVGTNTTSITIGTMSGSIAPGASTNLNFVMSNFTSKPGKYTFKATVPPVPSEPANFAFDNTLSTPGKIWFVPPGDVNFDGKANIIDLAIIASVWGSKCGDPNWNPFADLNGDCRITILDLAISAYWFGTVT